MKILILGSGLAGVTSAYELGKRGFDVTVLDRQAESGMETSFANGGQLSYSHAEPWATPGVLRKLPGWFFSADAPLVFRPRADWRMMKWGLSFLRNCTASRARVNCINILRLGLYSRRKFEQLHAETNIEFDLNRHGILHVFSDEKEYDAAKRQAEFQAKFGCEERIVSREECLAIEPSLAYASREIVGGIHAFRDEVGDSYPFCTALAKIAEERHGVKFRYNVTTKKLLAENGRISGVTTDQGDLSADGYVMALGSYSPVLLRDVGINLPVYPMKGYSVTLKANEYCPQGSISDMTYKVVYTRLGHRLRLSGTAEFAGYNPRIKEKRIAPILRAAKAMLPRADWNQTLEKWACLRPSTPTGTPILGPVPKYNNLFLNTGHGTLGWTQAAGSAAIVADIMQGKRPEILMHGLLHAA